MRIVVVPVAVYDPFFKQVRRGVEAAREAIRGSAAVDWIDVEDADPAHQAEIVRDTARGGSADALVICPIDRTALNAPIRECVGKGIPVATFCLDAPESGRFFHIGQDLRQSGRLAGFLMGKFLGGRGNVGIITGFFAVEGHEERRKGFLEVLGEDFPGIGVRWQDENHDHWEEAYEIAKRRLAGGGTDGIYITAGGPFGAARALEESLKTGGKRVSLVCFDFVPETVERIRNGFIEAAIGQDPFAQGYRSVTAAYELIRFGRKPGREIEHVNLEIAVRENVRYLGTA